MGEGFSREPKSELFLLAVTNMVSEKTFYEDAKSRDKRFVSLIRQVALEDPDWVARFVPYLRDTMNMRTASIVMAAELVHAKLTRPVSSGTIHNRTIIDSAIKRADEPAEMLGYWMSEWGKNFPQPVKRGVADAVERVYNERSTIKYDGGDKAIRFGDVIDLVHPGTGFGWKSALYRYLLDSRHKREIDRSHFGGEQKYQGLDMLRLNRDAMALDADAFRAAFSASFVENAGLTWEQASSKYGKLDAKFWEAMIPNMGIFALVRNLRNFDDAKISPAAREAAKTKLMDPETIRKSRMFPLRFFSAMVANKTLHYHEALEEAINVSVENVPSLSGKTLILCDLSGSMDWAISGKSEVKRLAPASIFAAALAIKAEKAELVAFSEETKVIPFRKDQSVLLLTKDLVEAIPHLGTQTWQAVKKHFKDHDRVIIVTDEQSDYSGSGAAGWGRRDNRDQDPSSIVPETTPIFIFNVAGYAAGTMPSGKKNRYTFGGLTDAAFTAIELLERGNDQEWPF
jgi:hypothetical protein